MSRINKESKGGDGMRPPPRLDEIRAALRRATAPDREIDFQIGEVITAIPWPGTAYWKPSDAPPTVYAHADTYTASVDAAWALIDHMAPGSEIMLQWSPRLGQATARIGAGPEVPAPLPALALVLALFEMLCQSA